MVISVVPARCKLNLQVDEDACSTCTLTMMKSQHERSNVQPWPLHPFCDVSLKHRGSHRHKLYCVRRRVQTGVSLKRHHRFRCSSSYTNLVAIKWPPMFITTVSHVVKRWDFKEQIIARPDLRTNVASKYNPDSKLTLRNTKPPFKLSIFTHG